MEIKLNEILALVGRLDDAAGTDTPRERFRQFLRESVTNVGQVRDYVEVCLRNAGEQYNRALQDLANHLGSLLGFQVTYGRYQGVQGKIGHDGLWKSPSGVYVVIEVKTSEAYAIKTSTLVGYMNDLVSEKTVPTQEDALGLYVLGRPDPEIRQLQNAIVAEKRTGQLRMISIESLLNLAELMNAYDVTHEDILALLRPSGPAVDPIVTLIARLVAAAPSPPESRDDEACESEGGHGDEALDSDDASYWLTPVSTDDEATAEQVIERLVGREHIYAFGDRTPGRKHLKPGDWMCFYASGTGIVAHARIASEPERKPHPQVRHSDKYPWTFSLTNIELYLDSPTVVDVELRARLDAFEGRSPAKAWAWLVQATRLITGHDFAVLTRRQSVDK